MEVNQDHGLPKPKDKRISRRSSTELNTAKRSKEVRENCSQTLGSMEVIELNKSCFRGDMVAKNGLSVWKNDWEMTKWIQEI